MRKKQTRTRACWWSISQEKPFILDGKQGKKISTTKKVSRSTYSSYSLFQRLIKNPKKIIFQPHCLFKVCTKLKASRNPSFFLQTVVTEMSTQVCLRQGLLDLGPPNHHQFCVLTPLRSQHSEQPPWSQRGSLPRLPSCHRSFPRTSPWGPAAILLKVRPQALGAGLAVADSQAPHHHLEEVPSSDPTTFMATKIPYLCSEELGKTIQGHLTLTAGQIHWPCPTAQGAMVVKGTKQGAAETSKHGWESLVATEVVRAETREEMVLAWHSASAWSFRK